MTPRLARLYDLFPFVALLVVLVALKACGG